MRASRFSVKVLTRNESPVRLAAVAAGSAASRFSNLNYEFVMHTRRIRAHTLAHVPFAARSGGNRGICAGGSFKFLHGLLETVGTIAVREAGIRAP